MWCKLVFVVSLALGVLGRSTFNDVYTPYHDPYDQQSQIMATQYCQATHHEDKVPEVKESIKTFFKCVVNTFDTEAIALEIAETRGTEAFDGVVKKHCAKSPELKVCTSGFIKGLAPCLPPGAARISENSIFAVIDFLCDNDGARIVSFVKEDGVDCIKQKQMEMAVCQSEMQSNITKIASMHGGGGLTGSLFIPAKEICILVGNGMSCFTNALTSCSNKTPGRLARELQDVYLDSLTCNEETQTEIVAVAAANQALAPSSGIMQDMDSLTKRKLELDVRTAELEIWNRENELNVQHTILTSDIKHNSIAQQRNVPEL